MSKFRLFQLKMQKKLKIACKKGAVNNRFLIPTDCEIGHIHFFGEGSDNEVVIGKNCKIKSLTVRFRGNGNRVIIGEDCDLNGVNIAFSSSNSTVRFGNRIWVNAHRFSGTSFNIGENTTVSIGDDCGISNNVTIFTTDYHGIYDHETLRRLNPDKDVTLGDHTIIFMRSTLLKGTRIAAGCAVGCGSVVAGKFDEPNCIIAGNPARVVRHGAIWDYGKDDILADARNYFG